MTTLADYTRDLINEVLEVFGRAPIDEMDDEYKERVIFIINEYLDAIKERNAASVGEL